MGKFIDEVAKINLNENHKLKISEEKNIVKNTLYKRIYKEFRDSDDINDAYDVLANIKTKNKICYEENHFGWRVTMEFVDTTYYRELKKVYKIFQEHEKTSKKQDEKQDVSSLYIITDKNGKVDFPKTIDRHVKNNAPYDIEKIDGYIIKHYNIYDNGKNLYDLKVYYFENTDTIDYNSTYSDVSIDGLLNGIKVRSFYKLKPLGVILAIPIIMFLLYLGFHALIGIGLVLFVILIILCS